MRAAQQLLNKCLADVQSGNHRPQSDLAYRELAEQWFQSDFEPRGLGRTKRSYNGILHNHVLPVFGHLSIKNISAQMCQQFVADKLTAGLAVNTVRNIRDVLRASLARAVE